MSAAELGQYKFQLEQVEEALQKDPDNKELQKLQHDLTELITLYSSLVPDTTATTTTSSSAAVSTSTSSSKGNNKRPAPTDDSPLRAQSEGGYSDGVDASPVNGEYDENGQSHGPFTVRWVVGQMVLAKWKDGKLYEATIEAVPTSASGHYTVIFKGYTSKEKVTSVDVKDYDPTQVAKPAAAVTGGSTVKNAKGPTRAFAAAFGNGEDRKSKKKKRQQEFFENQKQIDTEHVKKQSAWQAFAGGSSKKGAVLKAGPPLKKKSSKQLPSANHSRVRLD
jgi:survival-of-motor-neuron-related-splicing factor 30